MRGAFGVVSLLVVLAIVGLLVSRQMRATAPVTPSAAAQASAAQGVDVSGSPRQVRDRVRADLEKAAEAAERATKARADEVDR